MNIIAPVVFKFKYLGTSLTKKVGRAAVARKSIIIIFVHLRMMMILFRGNTGVTGIKLNTYVRFGLSADICSYKVCVKVF